MCAVDALLSLPSCAKAALPSSLAATDASFLAPIRPSVASGGCGGCRCMGGRDFERLRAHQGPVFSGRLRPDVTVRPGWADRVQLEKGPNRPIYLRRYEAWIAV